MFTNIGSESVMMAFVHDVSDRAGRQNVHDNAIVSMHTEHEG